MDKMCTLSDLADRPYFLTNKNGTMKTKKEIYSLRMKRRQKR